ncbi:MAG: hypothetical protein KKB13_28775 [Chloroflexi bacterium]|nr:hypothetical protein [Chloroflexota bacterium]
MKTNHILRIRSLLYVLAFLVLTAPGCSSVTDVSQQPPSVVTFVPAASEGVTEEAMVTARDVLLKRLELAGIKVVKATLADSFTIQVELMQASDIPTTVQLGTTEGRLIFFGSSSSFLEGELAPSNPNIVLTNEDISGAQLLQQDEQIQIGVDLTATGGSKLAEFTKTHIGEYLVVACDGKVIMSPQIPTEIRDTHIIISGSFTLESGTVLVIQLGSGRLPFKLKAVNNP